MVFKRLKGTDDYMLCLRTRTEKEMPKRAKQKQKRQRKRSQARKTAKRRPEGV